MNLTRAISAGCTPPLPSACRRSRSSKRSSRAEKKNGYLVFCIPVCCELDLKKAAKAAGDKKVELIHVKELLPLTGYLRGGCSPIGMKKTFPTFLDETAQLFDTIAVSAGQRGCQVILPPDALADYCEAALCDLVSLD